MSGYLKLNSRDILHGLIVAVLTSVLPIVQNLVANGTDLLSYDWAQVGKIAVSAGIGYLLKKLFSDESGKVFGAI